MLPLDLQAGCEPNTALWRAIRAHTLDDPAAERPLSLRLQQENGWTPAFTDRAIAEYRRFAYLSRVAGHAVTPSDEVDQVWHAHLLFSRDYWEVWCADVLGAVLHHEPSRGGLQALQHHRAQYLATLLSYERVFGHAAPADCWPGLDARFAGRHRRVDVQSHWVLPRPGAALQRARLCSSLGLISSRVAWRMAALAMASEGGCERNKVPGH